MKFEKFEGFGLVKRIKTVKKKKENSKIQKKLKNNQTSYKVPFIPSENIINLLNGINYR